MALLYVYNVNDLFRTLVDESDTTFLPDATVTSYLSIGYEQFRQAVSDVMPEYFVVSKDYTVSNVTELDLSTVVGPILGSTVAAPGVINVGIGLTTGSAGLNVVVET